MRIVEGTGFIQLECRGLHHINSHVGQMTSIDEDVVLELIEYSDGDDSEDEDEFKEDAARMTQRMMMILEMMFLWMTVNSSYVNMVANVFDS